MPWVQGKRSGAGTTLQCQKMVQEQAGCWKSSDSEQPSCLWIRAQMVPIFPQGRSPLLMPFTLGSLCFCSKKPVSKKPAFSCCVWKAALGDRTTRFWDVLAEITQTLIAAKPG